MVGSSISAVLSYIFKIQVPAPHGGFLILALVNSPLLWVGCILAGSVVGAILYVLAMPKISEKPSSKDSFLFHPEITTLSLKGKTKTEVIEEMVELLDKARILKDKTEFKKTIYKREALSTTGIGQGIAIPHAQSKSVRKACVAVGISKEGFDFESEDGTLAHMIFMIATQENNENLHLKTLSELSSKLMHEEFRDKMMQSESKTALLEILNS